MTRQFAQRYQCGHLVYFEHYRKIRDAIAREKQLKGWRRQKKNALISSLNPRWDDLAEDVLGNILSCSYPADEPVLSEAEGKDL